MWVLRLSTRLDAEAKSNRKCFDELQVNSEKDDQKWIKETREVMES